MKTGNNLYQTRHNTGKAGLGVTAFLLFLCVIISSFALCFRIGIFTYAKEADADIPIGEAAGSSGQSVQNGNSSSGNNGQTSGGSANGGQSVGGGHTSDGRPARPGFQASDSDKIWGKQTDIELFRVSYENGEHVITAAGARGQEIVAPGTENDYTFNLTNTGNVSIAYRVSAAAVLSDGQNRFDIPLKLRLSDYTGRYLIGGADSWADFESLGTFSESASLAAGHYMAYTIEWQWPYESGDDAFDTMLGNLSVDRDLVLTVTINVTAEASSDPNEPGGIPQTGDNSALLSGVMAVSGAVFILLLISLKKQKNDKEAGADV